MLVVASVCEASDSDRTVLATMTLAERCDQRKGANSGSQTQASARSLIAQNCKLRAVELDGRSVDAAAVPARTLCAGVACHDLIVAVRTAVDRRERDSSVFRLIRSAAPRRKINSMVYLEMIDPGDPFWDYVSSRPPVEVVTLLDLANSGARVPIGAEGARYVLNRLHEFGVQDGSPDGRDVVRVVNFDGEPLDVQVGAPA